MQRRNPSAGFRVGRRRSHPACLLYAPPPISSPPFIDEQFGGDKLKALAHMMDECDDGVVKFEETAQKKPFKG